MKKIVSKFIQSAVVLTALVAVVSVASAWTPPTDTFPAGNVPATVNTGNVAQTKASSFSVTGNLSASSNVNGANGFFSLLVNSAKGRFGCFLFCSDIASTDILKAGKYTGGDFSKGLTVSPDGLVATEKSPLWINLAGNTGVTGRNGLAIFTSIDNLTGGDGAVLQTSADKFSLVNLIGSDYVGLRAKRVQLTEGAGIGKVLTSDADGNAAWQPSNWIGDSIEVGSAGSAASDGKSGPAVVTVSAACPTPGATIISGGGSCNRYFLQGPIDLRPTLISSNGDLGSNSSTARWTVTCAGPAGIGFYSSAQVLCIKPVPGQTTGGGNVVHNIPTPPPVLTWHNVPTSTPAGTNGQTCQAWLNANGLGGANNPTYGGVLGRIGAVGTTGIPSSFSSYDSNGNSLSNAVAHGSCLYARNVGGQNYCDTGNADAAKSMVINGTATSLAPVATCPANSLVVMTLGNATTTKSITGTTQIKY